MSLLLILFSLSLSASAEEELQIAWTPYLWVTTLSADMDFGAGPAGTELDFDEILDKREGTYMHYLEFRKGQWGIANEIIYLNIADSKDGPIANVAKIDVDLKQSIVDLVVTYHTDDQENTMLFGGLRYINLETTLELTSVLPPLNGKIDEDKDWTNLLVGVRQYFTINDKWGLLAKGDIASDFSDEQSYIITLGANYDLSKLLDIKFGYRYAEIDFEDSDIEIHESVEGVFAGLTFNW